MTNIIVPVDFGASTGRLVQGAIDFAEKTGGRLFLIHVAPADLGFAIGDMGFQYFPEVQANEIRQELAALKKYEDQVKAAGLECEHVLKQGSAGDVILEYAREKNASYLVVGSHGRSNMYDVVVGSLTKELTRRAKIPLLVVPMH